MCAKMYSQLPRFNCVVSLVWFDCLVSFVVGTIRKVIITVSTVYLNRIRPPPLSCAPRA